MRFALLAALLLAVAPCFAQSTEPLAPRVNQGVGLHFSVRGLALVGSGVALHIPLRERIAVRAVGTLGASLFDSEAQTKGPGTLAHSDFSTTTVGLTFVLPVIRYVSIEPRRAPAFYIGAGPLVGVQRIRSETADVQNTVDGAEFTNESTDRLVQFGAVGMLGVEWLAWKRIGVSAEYQMGVVRTRTERDTTTEEPVGQRETTRTTTLTRWQGNASQVRLGLTLYL